MNLERVAFFHFSPPAPAPTVVPDPRRLSWRIPPGPRQSYGAETYAIKMCHGRPKVVPQPLNHLFLPRPQSLQVPAPLCLIVDVFPREALRRIEEFMYEDWTNHGMHRQLRRGGDGRVDAFRFGPRPGSRSVEV